MPFYLAPIDWVIVVLTLFFGIKGVFQGAWIPLFGLLGVVAGIYLGSLYTQEVSEQIVMKLFAFEHQILSDLIAFLGVFVIVWLAFIMMGALAIRLTSYQPALFGRMVGYLSTSTKYFVILSIVLSIFLRSELIKEQMLPYTKHSQILPVAHKISKFLLSPRTMHPERSGGKV